MASDLLTAQRRTIVLQTILRSWYLFGIIFLAAGVLNRIYITPRFYTLVQSRMEFNKYVLNLVLRINSQLSCMVTVNPTTTAKSLATSTSVIAEQTYVNAQTQTEDEQGLPSLEVPELSDSNELLTNSDDSLPLSYYTLRHLSQSLKVVPSLFATAGLSSTHYAANDLNLLIENLNFASATSGKGTSEVSMVSQIKSLATHLKEDIRDIKSLALTL
ncbi:hypothetical protein V1517DRAFT_371949 [Lipomyces orientalis]|uniref:Uncharacterized protein n=1 Tax=Lipomyces orientalis TaxID=1233043 RepID=A0ACC3TUS3_9ASCO